MKKTSRLLLCLFLALAGFPSGALTQVSDVLTRESDERVSSLEERQQTVATLLSAAEAAINSDDPVKAARFLNRAGRLQLLLSHPLEALKSHQQALSTIKDQDASTKIASLNGVAAAYTYMRKCRDAQAAIDEALDLSNQTHDTAGRAQALLTLSDCQNDVNQPEALKTAQEALELWKSVDNKWGIGKTYSAIGYYYLTMQQVTESAQNHEAALAIWRELEIPYEEAQALINLGFVEYRKAEWQNAISLFSQAQTLLDPRGYPFEMGQITNTLGEIFTEIGLTDAALSNLDQAAAYFRQTEEPLAIAAVALDTAKAYYAAGRYADAISTLQTTIADSEKINQPNVIGMCHEVLGQAYAALNDPTTALSHFQTALDLFTKSSRVMEAARVQARMGQVYAIQKKFPKADTYFTTALKKFQELSDRLNESATLYALGKLKLDQHDLESAERYLRQSIDVTENIRRTPTTSDLTAAFSATIHDRYQRYIDCLMLMKKTRPAENFETTAFELNEQERGRSLKELLQAIQTNLTPGIDPQLAQQEQSLRQTLTARENYKVTLLSQKYDPKQLAALDAEMDQLRRQYKETVDTIAVKFPSYGRVNEPSSWDLRRIQEQVVANDDTVLLEYSIGADRSYAWAITHDNIASYELPREAEITEAAQKVYTLLSALPDAASEDELARASNELSKLVLAPVAKSLDKRRIILVADNVLNYIPFQMLPLEAGNPQRLIESHEIVNAPSASIMGQLRQETARRQPAAKVLAAFGNPVFLSNYNQAKGTANSGELVADLGPASERWRDIQIDSDTFDPAKIQPLFYTTRELDNLREIAGDQTLLMTGFDASREILNSTDLTQYAILHFATHGFFNPRHPANSGFVLSMVNRDAQMQNGFIGLQDIYALKARVDLVVLSACRTGLGKDVRGEGLIGVTRGFMNAGASSAVASLWSVDDQATAELMKYFYANMLREGMPPAAALRAAQNTIRKNPRWSSPYYWAAFTFQGDYDRKISVLPGQSFTHQYLTRIVLPALLLLTGFLGWFIWRYRWRSKNFTPR
jgi:CHAT domain-containing protein/tetratricopeptide (TPR) repeat protein